MGETPQDRIHVHAIDPEQLAIISVAVAAAGARIAEAVNAFQAAFAAVVDPEPEPEPGPGPGPGPEPEPEPAYVPWSFHSPRHHRSVVSFLDPQNQVRHVPDDLVPDVPKAWRVLYVRE